MSASPLDDALLDRIRGRAAAYDHENAFFTMDLEELRGAGYLALLVPEELGGLGASLREASVAQARLAAAAPATALGVNMHLVWTAVAKILRDRGDTSLEWLLRETVEGQIFAFGVSEAGNDAVLFDSSTRAERQEDGSYRFTGRKVFTSLSPVWTRLGLFGRDDADPQDPRLVWGFLDRSAPGHQSLDDWDALGMRASQSRTTILDEAPVEADRIVRVLPVGPNGDPFVFGIFAAFSLLVASVYTGIGDRALELAAEAARRRVSPQTGLSYAQDSDVRHRIAHASIGHRALRLGLETLTRDVDAGADRGPHWFADLAAMKVRATETARETVEAAIRVAGGAAYGAGSELSRLYRDVLAGIFHPSDDESAHRTVATELLGPPA